MISWLHYFIGIPEAGVGASADKIRMTPRQGDAERFMTLPQVYHKVNCNDVPAKDEKACQMVFKALFMLLDIHVETECYAGDGRIDVVVLTAERIFIFEFKLRRSAKAALKHMLDKQ